MTNQDIVVSMSDSQEFDITGITVKDRDGAVIDTPGSWVTSDEGVAKFALIVDEVNPESRDITVSAGGTLGTARVTYTVPLSAGSTLSRTWVVTVHAGDPVTIDAHTGAVHEVPDTAATQGGPSDATVTLATVTLAPATAPTAASATAPTDTGAQQPG